jgi:carbon monoxide dehydrogenase subunit G
MTRIVVKKEIRAPVEFVFKSISDIAHLPQTVPDIEKVEFLSEHQSGVGTRFRETRIMKGKESTTELEVTEYTENAHIRMKADSHGTVWDSIFQVEKSGEFTHLTLTMDATAQKLLPKMMNPLMKGMYKKGLEKHVEAVKSYCETNFGTRD